MLNMKPNTYEVVSSKRFTDAAQLLAAVNEAIETCNQDPTAIYVTGNYATLQLEAECLSDGSIVYNLVITNR